MSSHTHWQVRCVSTPGLDTDLSLFVSFDNARFLFGCGEGTQRAFAQKRLSFRGLAGIFIGSGESRGRTGLAGCLMTAADAGISKVDIVGPPDLAHYIGTLRSCVVRDSLTVNTHSFPHTTRPGVAQEVFRHPCLTVQGIALRPKYVEPSPSSEAGPSSMPFDPTSDFRPTQLPRAHLQEWCNMMVGDMFHNKPKGRGGSPVTNGNPFVAGGGYIRAARVDPQYPLPIPAPEETATDMVYICQAPPLPGKFDVKLANALGVPNGPLRGRLVKGESIEVGDEGVEGGKRIIRPEDVLVGGGPGPVLIVVDCRADNLPTFLESSAFTRYQPDPDSQHMLVHLIVHRVPKVVWSDERYQTWMKSFGDKTEHLIASTNEYRHDIAYNSAAWSTLRLSLLDNDIFPLPHSITPSITTPDLPPNTSLLRPNHFIRMNPLSKPDLLRPHEKDTPFPSDLGTLQTKRREIASEMPEYAMAAVQARQAVRADPRWEGKEAKPGDDIVITTLGTGSAIPSKYRNVSSTHLNIPGLGGILLDAGEGTLGQLRRRFGPDNMRRIYEELRMVFISHMHADHHLGLQSILEDRFKHGITTPLYIVAPFQIALSLSETATWQSAASDEALDNVVWIDNRFISSIPGSPRSPYVPLPSAESDDAPVSDDVVSGKRRWPKYDVFSPSAEMQEYRGRCLSRLTKELGFTSICAPEVRHRGRAYGLVMTHESGWKVVYSGDTMPSENLVRAGREATLLIHEATLEDDKPEVAAEKGHSTFSQAINIGKHMGAEHILLNHFSQRYPKLPKLAAVSAAPSSPTRSPGKINPEVSISFDLMSLRVGDMWRMAHYMDAMALLFPEEEDEGDDTTIAVERDVNPTLDRGSSQTNSGSITTNGGSAETNAVQGKASDKGLAGQSGKAQRKAERKAKAFQKSDLGNDNGAKSGLGIGVEGRKRAVTPNSEVSEGKKGRVEMGNRAEMSIA